MPRVFRRVRAGCLVALTAAGCAHLPSWPSDQAGPAPPGAPTRPRATASGRGQEARRDAVRRASFDRPAPPGQPDQEATGPPLALSAPDCQCLAARNSTVANLLELKSFELAEDPGPSCLACSRRADPVPALQREVLQLASLEARNRSAGSALVLFYELAAADAKRGLLRRSLAEIDEDLANLALARERGLALKVNEGDLRRKRLELQDDDLELQLARGRLDGELRRLLVLSPADACRPLRPVGPTEIPDGPADEPGAVAMGLAHRPELLLLRRLHQALDPETLPVARQVLGTVDALLGLEPLRSDSTGPRLLALFSPPRPAAAPDPCAVQQQLALYLAERERVMAEEIAQAFRAARLRGQQRELARQQVQSWSAEVEEARARAAQGLASSAEGMPARAGLLKALSAQADHEAAFQVARVRLRQAQGLLADDCGPRAVAPP